MEVMREEIPDASVDLIYLDPPFNSKRTYNASVDGVQHEAFKDTWTWNDDAVDNFQDAFTAPQGAPVMEGLRVILGEGSDLAYLSYMANRLRECHRVLKDTGSIYLHCDPTASHYFKLLMDTVFGKDQFRNEIIWRRYDRPKGSQHKARRYGRSSDTILFYSTGRIHTFNADEIRTPLSQDEIDKRFSSIDDNGRFMSGPLLRSPSMGDRPNLVFDFQGYTPGPFGWRMTRENLQKVYDRDDFYFTSNGLPRRKFRPGEDLGDFVDNVWNDIGALGSQAKERIGYPTQKPVALLERIIKSSSNKGDTVLDPFCGCGTTLCAAQHLNRNCIGIDVSELAIQLTRERVNGSIYNGQN